MQRAKIKNLTFDGCTVDDSIKFAQLTSCSGAKIDRFTLKSLGRDRGGLTPGNLMDMDVEDDVAILRSQFGGIWAALHLIALIVFVSPYAWFLPTHYAIAKWNWAGNDKTITIVGAFARFIFSGGKNWLSFGAFILYFIYNAARLLLVWKTKTLETKQNVTGYPVRFKLHGTWWGTLCNFLFWAVIGAVIIVTFNTYNFLMVELPVEANP